jgi:hypothetical protein
MTTSRVSAGWYALPAALVVLVLGFVWLLAGDPIGGTRAATVVAGPGESVEVLMEPGQVYRLYHSAADAEIGRNCRIDPAGGQAAGLRFGQWRSWSDVLYASPETVVVEGREYRFALQVSHAQAVPVTVSCAGGPVLVDGQREIRWSVVAVLGIGLVAVLAATAGVAWARRRRPDGRDGSGSEWTVAAL